MLYMLSCSTTTMISYDVYMSILIMQRIVDLAGGAPLPDDLQNDLDDDDDDDAFPKPRLDALRFSAGDGRVIS